MTAESTLINFARGHALLNSRMGYFMVVMLLLLAAVLRMTDLATLPQGFSEDEITNIRLVDNVRQGDIYVFYPSDDGGREGIYHVLQAFATTFVGEGTIGFRMPSLWLSILSIAIIYTLGNHLFNPIVGVLAAGLVTVNMSHILLARTVSSDATIFFLMSATLLALARSLPVYRRTRVVSSNIVSFAALGALLGLGFYLHPSSLFIVIGAMLYIAHLLYVGNVMFVQRRSYTGFAILLMLIISMPYLISSINLPQYSAGQRFLAQFDSGLPASIVDGFLGIFYRGDMDPVHNLPGRPLVEIFSGMFMLLGIVICFRRRHRPRFMLVLIMFSLALPAAFVVDNSPNFARMNVILPLLALFFGMGVYSVIRAWIFVDVVFRRMAVAAMLVLFALNVVWTWQDLFNDWRDNDQVLPLVNADLGQIARYLDLHGYQKPVVFCIAAWDNGDTDYVLTEAELTLLMMNRQEFVYREVDCSRTLLLTQGGESQRIVFFGADVRDAVHPYLREWLDRGRPVTDNLPRGAVLELESEQLLADRAGAFTTTAPVSYAPEVVEQLEAIPPPIRFGGNLTLLGYEPNVERNFLPGDFVDVITYWRVEGELAPDLTIFNHILSDPDFPFGVRDVIGVKPSLMHGRDVFIQVTPVQLRETALPGEYYVSVGAYLPSQNNERLPVLLGEQAHGNRIYLYPINVLPLPADTESGG